MTLPDYDRLSEAQLRAAGGLKWTAFPDCIGAFVAEMDFGIAPPVAAALQDAVARGRTGYPSPALADALAQACAQWQATHHGWVVPPERIHAVGDVLGALEIAMAHFMPASAPIVLPTPAYMPFLPLIALHGRQAIEVPHRLADGAWRMDLDAIDAALRHGAGLVLLCNPQNPTGRVFEADELRALSEVVERRGARVFSDEIHAPLVHAGHRHVPYASVSAAAAAHAITAVSVSKGWNLPGLKCAQLVLTSDADLATWRRIHLVAGHDTSALGMIASTAAWHDGDDWLSSVRDYLAGNRALVADWLHAHLPETRFVAPQGTYLAWIDVRDLPLPADIGPARFFRRHAKVALTDGAECGEAGRGHVRLNFAMPRPLLREALARITDAVPGREA